MGTLIGPSPIKYIGMWKAGKKNGKGKFIYPDRTIYAGEFINDMRHGSGIFTL